MNELTVTNQNIVRSVDDLIRLGATLLKSGLLPTTIKTPEAATAIILKGSELGIGAMEALSSINVILGKPTTSPQLMLALARRTKELEDIKIEDDGSKCVVTIKRKGQTPVTTSFSMEDAKAMNLSGKDNWNKQPKVMRQWRALAANLRLTFPDAISGLFTHEEMGAEVVADSEGNMTVTKMPEVIEGTYSEQPQEHTQEQPQISSGSAGDYVLPFKKAKDLTGKDRPTLNDIFAKGKEGINYLNYIRGWSELKPESKEAIEKFFKEAPKDYDTLLNEFKSVRADIKALDESKIIKYSGDDINTIEKLEKVLAENKKILAELQSK